MAEVIVTRPAAAAERTAARLRADGHTPLVAPLLSVVAMPPPRLAERPFAGLVLTSAAALDAVADHPDLPALCHLPVWAVGVHTAARATASGFAEVRSGEADAAGLAALLRGTGRRDLPYLYLSAEEAAADLTAMLAPAGIVLERRVVYRTDVAATLPPALVIALRERAPAAVLHFSMRSAQAYVDLATAAGLAPAALLPLQLCLSEQIAAVLAAAGATAVAAADAPSEAAMLAGLGRQGGHEPLNSRMR